MLNTRGLRLPSFPISLCATSPRRRLSFGVLALALACAPKAMAADPDDAIATDENASDLVREGVRMRRAHKNEEALALFQRAYERAPTSATRAQIAFAEQALGRFLEAEHDLVLALAEQDDWVGRHRVELEESLRLLQGHLAWLRVDVNAGADVTMDGSHVDPGKEVRTSVGRHRIVVRAAQSEQTRDVDVAPREHARAIFLMEAPAPVPSPLEHPFAHDQPVRPKEDAPVMIEKPSRVGPLVLGSVGVAGLAVGTWFGIDTLHAKSDRQAHCRADNTCDAQGIDADSRLRTSSTISTIAFAVGIGAAAGAVVWWVLQEPRRMPVSVAIGGPGGIAGGTLAGRF